MPIVSLYFKKIKYEVIRRNIPGKCNTKNTVTLGYTHQVLKLKLTLRILTTTSDWGIIDNIIHKL